jgi:hypothetical protein
MFVVVLFFEASRMFLKAIPLEPPSLAPEGRRAQ